jgi:hypothetical protein
MNYSIKQLQDMVYNEKRLPPDFDQWYVKINKEGTTFAHLAAKFKCLPLDFDRWYIRDKKKQLDSSSCGC